MGADRDGFRPKRRSERRRDVAAGPAAIAPRHIPARARRQFVRDRIKPRRAPGMTTQDAREPDPKPRPKAKPPHGILGVFRAGRQIAALPAHQRRQRIPIDAQQEDRRPKVSGYGPFGRRRRAGGAHGGVLNRSGAVSRWGLVGAVIRGGDRCLGR